MKRGQFGMSPANPITTIKILAWMILVLPFTSCDKESKNNELSATEKEEGYILLFDGTTTNGWHVYNQGKVNSTWQVANGELYCEPANMSLAHGDLVSDDEFENYDLKFEWKIREKGNSGVFINVKESADIPTAWTSGPEYQLLEQMHRDAGIETKRSGCLYGFGPQVNAAAPTVAGEWNESRIRQVDGKIEFYLNGKLTAQQDLNSPQWQQMILESGFKSFPEFGKYTRGRVALQEWDKGVSFRNIKLRKL